jgi:hypothetical protein
MHARQRGDEWFSEIDENVKSLEKAVELGNRRRLDRTDRPSEGQLPDEGKGSPKILNEEAEPARHNAQDRLIELTRSSTEAARAATEAARSATHAAIVAADETRYHSEIARSAESKALVALYLGTGAVGACIAFGFSLLAIALLLH